MKTQFVTLGKRTEKLKGNLQIAKRILHTSKAVWNAIQNYMKKKQKVKTLLLLHKKEKNKLSI